MATTNIAAKKMAGVVVGAGRMMKTVKVRMAKEEWNRHLRKVSVGRSENEEVGMKLRTASTTLLVISSAIRTVSPQSALY